LFSAIQDPEELHAWNHERIGALRRERQSHWEHIVALVTGRTRAVVGP
jgi:hypothetical protein